MKVVISKQKWQMIGEKAGWFRFAAEGEIIEVDGKKYKEVNGDLVEMTLEQPEQHTPKSFTIPAFDITFKEGEEYENWFGIYRVLKIVDDKFMDVEYLQSFKPQVHAGEIKRYPMLSQAETISKASKQSEQELNKALNMDAIVDFNDPDDFFTMGYVAAHGYISAEIGPKYHKSFPLRYKSLTGEDPSKYLGAGYGLSPNKDRWSYTLRIKLPMVNEQIGRKLDLPQNNIVRKTGIEINDNAFVWGLFRKGFSIGRNNGNVDKILSTIPSDAKDIFLSGFNS